MWDYLFFKIAFLTLTFSVAGLIVMLFTRIFSKTLTKTQCYYLWLIPLILAILPVMGMNFNMSTDTTQSTNLDPSPIIQEEVSITKNDGTIQGNDAVSPNNDGIIKTNNMASTDSILNQANIKGTNKVSVMTQIILLAWFLGILSIGIYQTASYIYFRRKLTHVLMDSDETINAIWEKENINRKVSLKTISTNISPFVTGLRRPVIVIPNSIQSHELRPILLHELTHLKHRDLLYSLLIQLVKTLHFFNPLSYVFSKEIKKLMELACDEKVSQTLTFDEKKAYSTSILSMMKAHNTTSQMALCLSENATNIKERLDIIMKKTYYTKATKIFSIILLLIVFFTSTAFATTINTQNPAKNSYVVNKLDDSGSFSYSYTNDEKDALTGDGNGTREIVLINSPLYKNFYAHIKLPIYTHRYETRDGNGDSQELKTEKQNVTAEIRMNSIEKVLNSGNNWVGKFTVSINDAVIFDNITGYINNIPSNKKNPAYSQLLIYDEETKQRVTLDGMNFNLAGDDMINASYEKDQVARNLKEDAKTKKTYIYEIKRVYFNEQEIQPSTPSWGNTIFYNIDQKNADFWISIPRKKESQISIRTDYREVYQCTADSIKGNFFVSRDAVMDEFYGTVTGLSGKLGDTVKIISDDKRYEFEFLISDYAHSEESRIKEIVKSNYDVPPTYATSTDPAEKKKYTMSAFATTAENNTYRIKTSMLPFTFALTPGRTGVKVDLKKGLKYDGWTSIMATYSGGDLGNIWEEKSSKDGKNTWNYSVLSDTTPHFIQFDAYTKEPYAHMEQYTVCFKIIDNKIFYIDCYLYTLNNKNYRGDAARDMIFQFSHHLGRLLGNRP